MSTPRSESGWTVDTLKEHIDALRAADQTAIQAALSAAKEAVGAALDAAKEAVLKAEGASDKRFEGVNEFRATLSDQQRMLIPRAEAEIRLAAIQSQLDALKQTEDARGGERVGQHNVWGYVVGAVGLLIGVLTFAMRFIP